MLPSCGAEGVCGTEEDRLALCDQDAGQLAAGRRLARAIDSDHEDDCRLTLRMIEVDGPIHVWSDKFDQLVVQDPAGPGRIGDAVNRQFRAQLLDQFRGRAHAKIRGDEGGFEVIPGVVVELVGAQELCQTTGQGVVAVGQTATESCHPRARSLRSLNPGFGRRLRLGRRSRGRGRTSLRPLLTSGLGFLGRGRLNLRRLGTLAKRLTS